MFDRKTLLFLAGVFLSLSWVAPNHETPWLSFHVEILAALAGICFALFAAVSGATRVRQVPAAVIVLLLVAAIPWIQWCLAMSPYRGDALLASMYTASAAIMMWAGFVTHRDHHREVLSALALSMVWSAILSTGMALYQTVFQSGWDMFVLDPPAHTRATGNLGQPNHLATLLMFGLASVMWLRDQRKLGRGVALLAAAFLVLGFASTRARQPLVGLLLLGIWSVRARSLRGVRPVQWLEIAMLLVWLVAAYVGIDRLTADANSMPIADGNRLKPGLRPLLWDQFAHAIAEAPWLGYGWQGGLTAQGSVAVQHPGLEFAQYAHNLFIDLVTWNGVPLGVVLVVLSLVWYWRIGQDVRDRGGWFQLAILTFVLGHSLVEYSFAYTYFLLPAALAAGQLEATSERTRWKLPRWCVPGIAVAMAGFLAVVIADYLALAAERRELITWKARIGGDHPLPALPRTLMLDQLAASIEWMRNDATPGMTSEQIEQQTTLSRRYPTVALLTRTAMVLALNDRADAGYTEVLRLRGLFGEAFYTMATRQIRDLAATSQPKLRPLALIIDQKASSLPPLPVLSQELSGHRFQW